MLTTMKNFMFGCSFNQCQEKNTPLAPPPPYIVRWARHHARAAPRRGTAFAEAFIHQRASTAGDSRVPRLPSVSLSFSQIESI